MGKKTSKIVLIIFGFAVLALLLHLYTSFFLSKYYGISVGDIILIITATLVFWYAWETREIRKEQTAPFISVLFKTYSLEGRPDEKTDVPRFLVVNEGKGTATNIELRTLKPIDEKTPTFNKVEALPPGGQQVLTITKVDQTNTKTVEGRQAHKEFIEHIRHRIDSDEFKLELKYNNLLDNEYRFQGSFDKSIPGTWVFTRKTKEEKT